MRERRSIPAYRFLRAASLLAGACMTSPLVAAAPPGSTPSKIILRSVTIDTSAAQVPQAGALQVARPAAQAVQKPTHALFQLDGPMSPNRAQQLRAAGVGIESYIAPNCFVCNIKQANPLLLAQCGFVRWRGDFAPQWKLDPDLDNQLFQTPQRQALKNAGQSAIVITLFANEPTTDVTNLLTQAQAQVHQIDSIAGNPVVVATVASARLPQLAQLACVQYIENAPELTDRSNIASNWVVQSDVLNVTPLNDAGLTGAGQTIGIIDSSSGGLDINHCSFSDAGGNPIGPLHRKLEAYNTTPGVLAHASHVSATAAGSREDGVVDNTRGIAFDARIVYNKFPAFQEALIYNSLMLHHSQGARVHSNSWGDDSVAFYTSLCRGID